MTGNPLPLVYRHEPGHLITQDIISGIEVFACATLSQELAAKAWGAVEDPDAASPRQLAAMGCDLALNHPWAHPERIRAFDNVERVIVSATAPREIGGSTETTVEIGRVQLDRWGIGVLERIATYARLGPTVGGVPVPGVGIILGGPTGQTVQVAGPGSSAGVSDPSPFPFPSQGVDAVSSPAVDLRFHLINYEFSRGAPDEPPWFVGREQDIPQADVIPPWRDMRYQWGALYTEGHQFVCGGHSLLRLFVRVRLFDFGSLEGAYLKFVTRLAGFRQLAGPWRAAEGSALSRSW